MKRLLAGTAMLLCAVSGATAEELVYWSVWTEPEPQAQVLQQIFDKYEEAHPDVTIKPIWNGRQNLVQMRSYLAAGNSVDIIDGDARQYLGLMMKEDIALDLSDIAEELEPVALPHTISLMRENDIQYGIPYIHNAVVFLYSKAAFEEAGISEVPNTLDELFAVCDKLNEAGYAPIAAEGTLDFFSFYYATYLLNQIAGRDYIRTLVEDRTGESWRSDEVGQMLEHAKAFWDRGCIPEESKGYQWPTAQQNIAFGDTAMELVGSWVPTELASAVEEGFEWGAFKFPDVEGGANTDDLNTAMMTIGVHKDTAAPDIAKDVVRFIMSQENQQLMATQAEVGVIRQDVEWIPALQDVKRIIENAPGAIVEDHISAYYPDYGANIMLPIFGKYFTGQISAEEYMNTMAEKTREYWANQ